jgi:hypothetical protein
MPQYSTQGLSPDDVARLNLAMEESWQKQLIDLVDGAKDGFAVHVVVPDEEVAEETDPEERDRLRRAKVMAGTNATYNAIKWRLGRAAEHAGMVDFHGVLVLTRSGSVVRVMRKVVDGRGTYAPLPHEFVDAIKTAVPRHGATRRKEFLGENRAKPRRVGGVAQEDPKRAAG